MTALTNEFADLILEFTGKAGISITEKQALLLSRHIQIMLEWNPRLNLTRITGPEEIIVKHLLDSILPAKFLPKSGHALDIGTGAGFPGVPLKIVNPDLQIVLLDSSRKKVSFLAAMTAALGLKGIRPLHGRWQDFSKAEDQANKFDLITMRAVKLEAEHITGLAPALLAPAGVLAWWGAGEERTAGHAEFEGPNMEFQGDFEYLLPGMKQRRAVWIWKKM
ncbi:Ribosomal RNA small subunit methyltransferase G 1 [Syntrophobacter sp. SbD1]|nr:Ribosomal RNA small subunit methyltransferase G 1 [Syntrophobacter sp. SbD1]